ncbi:MAG: hypothetical protein SX243_00610 [Acidobacteriota bacterium]|nr:hypothetical protein [Acidobacteriota bacterium]
MGWIVAMLIGAGSSEAQIFPKQMTFRVKGGFAQGSFDLSFSESLSKGPPKYSILLRNFGGLGMTSSQELWSYVFQEDLSLYGHLVQERGGPKIREVFLNDNCKSAMGQVRTTCFLYKEYTSGDSTQAELFAKEPAIDLISSLLVATREASKGSNETKDYVFVFEDSAKKVSLVPVGEKSLSLPQAGEVSAAIWSLRPRGETFELYRFYIARDRQGRFFPAKVEFEEPSRGLIELTAESWTW